MKEIISRFFAESPKFFKRLKAIGASVSGTGIALAAISGIPPTLAEIGAKMIWIGATMVAVSQLTCQDPTDVTPSK